MSIFSKMKKKGKKDEKEAETFSASSLAVARGAQKLSKNKSGPMDGISDESDRPTSLAQAVKLKRKKMADGGPVGDKDPWKEIGKFAGQGSPAPKPKPTPTSNPYGGQFAKGGVVDRKVTPDRFHEEILDDSDLYNTYDDENIEAAIARLSTDDADEKFGEGMDPVDSDMHDDPDERTERLASKIRQFIRKHK